MERPLLNGWVFGCLSHLLSPSLLTLPAPESSGKAVGVYTSYNRVWPVRWRCLAAWVSVTPEPHGRKTEKIPTSRPLIIRALWHIKFHMIFKSKLEKQTRTNGRNFNLFSITNTLSHLSQLSISIKKNYKNVPQI